MANGWKFVDEETDTKKTPPAASTQAQGWKFVDEEPEAPAQPAVPVEQDTQTVMQNRLERQLSDDPEPFTNEEASEYVRMLKDLNVPESAIADYVNKRGGVWTPDASAELEYYRQAIREGRTVSDKVTYQEAAPEILGAFTPDVDPTIDSDFQAAFEQGMANSPHTVLTQAGRDLMDGGATTKEELAERFPQLDDESLERLHDAVLGEHRRREIENARHQVEARDVGTATELLGDFTGGVSAFDAIPLGRGLSFGGQLAEGAIINKVTDDIMQAQDIAYGAQDKYSVEQNAMAVAAGTALQGAFHGVARGAEGIGGAFDRLKQKRTAGDLMAQDRMAASAIAMDAYNPDRGAQLNPTEPETPRQYAPEEVEAAIARGDAVDINQIPTEEELNAQLENLDVPQEDMSRWQNPENNVETLYSLEDPKQAGESTYSPPIRIGEGREARMRKFRMKDGTIVTSRQEGDGEYFYKNSADIVAAIDPEGRPLDVRDGDVLSDLRFRLKGEDGGLNEIRAENLAAEEIQRMARYVPGELITKKSPENPNRINFAVARDDMSMMAGHFNLVNGEIRNLDIEGYRPGENFPSNAEFGPAELRRVMKQLEEKFPVATGVKDAYRVTGGRAKANKPNAKMDLPFRGEKPDNDYNVTPINRDVDELGFDSPNWEAETHKTLKDIAHSVVRGDIEGGSAYIRELLDEYENEVGRPMPEATRKYLEATEYWLQEREAWNTVPEPANDLDAEAMFGQERGNYGIQQAFGADIRNMEANENFVLPNEEADALRDHAIDIQKRVLSASKNWAKRPAVQTVESVEDARRVYKDNETNEAIFDERTKAFYTPEGKIIIIAENIPSAEDASSIIFHEALGHQGLAETFGDGLHYRMLDAYNNNDTVRAYADAYADTRRELYEEWEFNYGKEVAKALAAEEWFASKSESGSVADLPRNVAKEVLDWIKNFIRDKLGVNVKMTDGEAMRLLSRAHRTMIYGPSGKGVIRGNDRFEFADLATERAEISNQIAELRELHRSTDSDLERYAIAKEIEEAQADLRNLDVQLGALRPSRRGDDGVYRSGQNKAGNINLDKINSTRDIDDILKENATSNGTQSQEETLTLAKELGLTAKQLIEKNPEMTPEYAVAARQILVTSANKVHRWAEQIANGQNGDEQLDAFAEALVTHAAIQERVTQITSNAGRILNSFNIAAQGRTGQAANLRYSLKGGNSDNGVLTDKKNLEQLAVQLEANKHDKAAINKITRDALKPMAEDYIFSVWYNMLLSGPKTHVANIFGTLSNFGMDLLEHGGAAVLGQGRRITGNTDRVLGREVLARHVGAVLGIKTALKNAGIAFQLGVPLHRVSRVETSQAVFPKPLSYGIEGPTRFMAATDEFFRNIIQMSEYYGSAVRNAHKEGLTGRDFWDRVNELIQNPTEDMYLSARNYAQRLQFLDDPSSLGAMLEKGRMAKPDDGIWTRIGKGILRIILPFVRTPDSLLRTAIRRSPLGALGMDRYNTAGWQEGGANADLATARVVFGTMLTAYIANMAMEGEISGEGPQDYRKREELENTGWQPNSVKIGDTWYSYQGMEPLSIPFSVIGTVVERLKYSDLKGAEKDIPVEPDMADKAFTTVFGIAQASSNNTWMEGLSDALGILESDNTAQAKAEVWLANVASSAVVPAAVRQYNEGMEDNSTRISTGDNSFGDRILGRIKSGVPGLSDDLPQAYDILGRPKIKQDAAMGGRTVSRLNMRDDEDDDPVAREIRQLTEGQSGTVVTPLSRSNVPTAEGKRDLNAEEFSLYQYVAGQALRNEIADRMATDPEWYSMTSEKKVKEIKKTATKVRKEAREALFGKKEDLDVGDWEFVDDE